MRSLRYFFPILWTPAPASPLMLMLQQPSRLLPSHNDGRSCRSSSIRESSPSVARAVRCRPASRLHLSAQPEYDEIIDDININPTLPSPRRRSQRTKAKARTSNKRQKNGNGASARNNDRPYTTMSTAVCIVPPDDVWDTIQRARHLARDTTFYKWPPAIRLFHPFAPKGEVPSLVGKVAEWIEDEMEEAVDYENSIGLDLDDDPGPDSGNLPPASYLQSFEVTLDSIQILPHWEVLDARIEALEERMPQQNLGSTIEERAYQKRKAEGMKLIEEEERRGLERKKERDRKKERKQLIKAMNEEGYAVDEEGCVDRFLEMEKNRNDSRKVDDDNEEGDDDGGGKDGKKSDKNKNAYNGPCVIYLAPNDESRAKLEAMREKLRKNLFGTYDAFSPSSSVSPYPEQLPRKVTKQSSDRDAAAAADDDDASDFFKPLLPIARFPTVQAAVKVAKVLQRTWDPLTFNVTDIQFVSRSDEANNRNRMASHDATGLSTSSGVGFGNNANSGKNNGYNNYNNDGGGGGGQSDDNMSDMDIPEVRHRQKHNTLHTMSSTKDRMALTSSGEVEDVSKRGVYGCDAMVMLWGEEPEEELMEEEASLSMIMDDNDDDDDGEEDENNNGRDDVEQEQHQQLDFNGKINYDQIFATAEREYQRMQAHEELSEASYVGDEPIFDSSPQSKENIEAWLDDDEDDLLDDEGATVVVGRAQFFMGAMREFIGMPASSAIDSKGRIMGGGISAVARRRGSVHRLSESWDAGDYGKKESDHRPWIK